MTPHVLSKLAAVFLLVGILSVSGKFYCSLVELKSRVDQRNAVEVI